MGGRGARLASAVVAVVALLGGGACGGNQAAETCVATSGANFCVTPQGDAAVEPTATGLQPGTTLTIELQGGPAGAEPFTSAVAEDGSPEKLGVIGYVSLIEQVDLAGTSVVFTGTAADGTPVAATVVVPG